MVAFARERMRDARAATGGRPYAESHSDSPVGATPRGRPNLGMSTQHPRADRDEADMLTTALALARVPAPLAGG